MDKIEENVELSVFPFTIRADSKSKELKYTLKPGKEVPQVRRVRNFVAFHCIDKRTIRTHISLNQN